MLKKIILTRQTPFWLLAFSILIVLTLPKLIQDGMFMDAMLYTSVSHNLSLGIGTFWFPQFSVHNLAGLSSFHEQPPLIFGFQAIFFKILELEDKYKGTMETLGKTIGELSANTLLDKLRFFELTVFNYIIGNNDMHLKNFSMWLSDIGWVLSPAYDLLNVKIILPNDMDETALLFGGKKKNFNKENFNRFGEILKLNEKQINSVFKKLVTWLPKAIQLIDISFLNDNNKIQYKNLIIQRINLLIS